MCCRRSCRWMTNLIVAPRIRRGVETLEVEEGTQLQAKTSSMIYLASVCVVVVKRRGVIAPDVRCVETRGTCKQSVVAQRAKSVAQLVASRGSRNFSSARQQQQRTQRKTGRVGRAASSPLSRTWNRWPPLQQWGGLKPPCPVGFRRRQTYVQLTRLHRSTVLTSHSKLQNELVSPICVAENCRAASRWQQLHCSKETPTDRTRWVCVALQSGPSRRVAKNAPQKVVAGDKTATTTQDISTHVEERHRGPHGSPRQATGNDEKQLPPGEETTCWTSAAAN